QAKIRPNEAHKLFAHSASTGTKVYLTLRNRRVVKLFSPTLRSSNGRPLHKLAHGSADAPFPVNFSISYAQLGFAGGKSNQALRRCASRARHQLSRGGRRSIWAARSEWSRKNQHY